MEEQSLWHHTWVHVDFFFQLNLLPPYSLRSQGDNFFLNVMNITIPFKISFTFLTLQQRTKCKQQQAGVRWESENHSSSTICEWNAVSMLSLSSPWKSMSSELEWHRQHPVLRDRQMKPYSLLLSLCLSLCSWLYYWTGSDNKYLGSMHCTKGRCDYRSRPSPHQAVRYIYLMITTFGSISS